MFLIKYIYIYMDFYRVVGFYIFFQKSLINDGNVFFVWNYFKEGWGCIVINDSVFNFFLKLLIFYVN